MSVSECLVCGQAKLPADAGVSLLAGGRHAPLDSRWQIGDFRLIEVHIELGTSKAN